MNSLKIKMLIVFLSLSYVLIAQKKPNIVMIMVDDVGYFDLSCYHRGLASYQTPNIDRIAKEGKMLTDYYAQPSCTAGRAAIITGQYPIRTGLTSVGQPGQKLGIQKEDPTLATLLKEHGYKTALFGKWHMGDRNEYLPTVHGFDEFYGMLYHLNMMEMSEQPEFPKNPDFSGNPRNVIWSYATTQLDTTVDKRWGMVGKQKIVDKGPLPKAKMADIDEIFGKEAGHWLEKNHKDPFFLWFTPTRMHQITHVPDRWKGKSGMSTYADGLMQLDFVIGQLLDKLKELKVDDNTIILFTSDNGVNMSHWPDAGTAGFRGEKGTTWEGGFRVPMIVKWPGKIEANTYSGEFFTSEDWLPTLMAGIGDMDIKDKLLNGHKGYKVHLDGYNQLGILIKNEPSKRREFFYYGENDLNAMRVDQWKVHTAVKDEWLDAPRKIDGGLLINIKLDPFERSPDGKNHFQWMKERSWVVNLFAPHIRKHQESIAKFPPRQVAKGIGASTLK
jgi:arylsulfatase A-like enzyme